MDLCERLGLVSEESYAEFSGLKLSTLKRHRTEKIGVQPVEIGTRRFYRIRDIELALSATPVASGTSMQLD